MSKDRVPACIVLILALVIAVGSQTFLGACIHEDGSFGACHWASRMLMGLGGLMAVMALAGLLMKRARFGLYVASVLTALLGMMTPGPIIALCGMPTMRCRMVMQPAMLILCALAGIAAVAGAVLSRKS